MKQLMLIHDAIGGADQLFPLKELLKNEFEIHLLEFDGHGSKASINDPFSLESFDRQLGDMLDSIGQYTHVFGYSMGGFVALWSAANGNNKIASITTLGTKMAWSEAIAEKEIKHLNPDAIIIKVPKFAEVLRKRHGEKWQNVLIRTADFMTRLGKLQPIQESLISRISIPVQLCLADNDVMVSLEETQQVHQWISGSSFEMISNSKHPIEQVDLTVLADTIRSFMNRMD
ncbi:alpha/beta fold hydrolase [Ekhidna sp. To15]|uniref:alpha/beta fold hydrolase n=1 Tax=Ekhidna sp. To15 TaxID=3395267 RepID=UPI003F51F4CA